MSAIKQIASVVSMNVRAIQTRFAASLVIVVGMAAVVAVALSIFSMSAGLLKTAKENVTPDHMVVVSLGADNESSSNIPHDALPTIGDTPGIKKGPDGKPFITAQADVSFFARKKVNGVDTPVMIRGVGANIFDVRPELKISAGRMFTPGLHELIVGKNAISRFQDVDLGNQIRLQDGPWTVVGVFESVKGGSDFGLMGDAETLLAAQRRTTFNMAVVRLEDGSKAAQTQFVSALKSNPILSVDAETEESYATRNLKNIVSFYTFLAYGVGGIMGLGAIFAALNTMYAAVSTRLIEIATLRAIGFGATPVVISIMVEGLGLAVIGAVTGALIAWIVFNGHKQEMGFLDVTQAVTPPMIAVGIGAALIVGTIGALFPAIRAARLPVATALQVR